MEINNEIDFNKFSEYVSSKSSIDTVQLLLNNEHNQPKFGSAGIILIVKINNHDKIILFKSEINDRCDHLVGKCERRDLAFVTDDQPLEAVTAFREANEESANAFKIIIPTIKCLLERSKQITFVHPVQASWSGRRTTYVLRITEE